MNKIELLLDTIYALLQIVSAICNWFIDFRAYKKRKGRANDGTTDTD